MGKPLNSMLTEEEFMNHKYLDAKDTLKKMGFNVNQLDTELRCDIIGALQGVPLTQENTVYATELKLLLDVIEEHRDFFVEKDEGCTVLPHQFKGVHMIKDFTPANKEEVKELHFA